MKRLALFLTICLFIGLNMLPHLEGKNTPPTPEEFPSVSSQTATVKGYTSVGNFLYVIAPEYLEASTLINPPQKVPVYYVKINNTISLLKDPHGYILAAEKLKMEEIMIVPDGKYYRTVSLDLHKSDEDLKNAIPVKVNEIIRK